MQKFRDQVVIVTGASSGIGLETARAFAAAGARVVPASRRSTPPCDVTKDNDVRQLVEEFGLAPDRCLTTLERHMKCGVGKCGHCVVVDRYVCVDGPVWRYDELLALDRIEPPW